MSTIIRNWIMAAFLFPMFTYAQSVSVGLGGGFISIQRAPFYTDAIGEPGIYTVNGTVNEFRGLGLQNEFQLAGTVEMTFPNFPATFALSVDYGFFRGNGNTLVFDTKPMPISPYYYTYSYAAKATTKFDLLSISLGTNVYLFQGKFSPFIGLKGQLNRFGELSTRIDYYGSWFENKNLDPYTRFGIGIGPGLDFTIFPVTVIRMITSYNIYNLAGKRSEEVNLRSSSVNIIVLHSFSL